MADSKKKIVEDYDLVFRVLRGELACVKELLASGSSANAVASIDGDPEQSALMGAVIDEDCEMVSVLLEHGADPNYFPKSSSRTPLMECSDAWQNHKENLRIAKLLLKHGADPMYADQFGITAISIAADRQNRALIKLFHKHGVDFTQFNSPLVKPSECLHYNITSSQTKIKKMLQAYEDPGRRNPNFIDHGLDSLYTVISGSFIKVLSFLKGCLDFFISILTGIYHIFRYIFYRQFVNRKVVRETEDEYNKSRGKGDKKVKILLRSITYCDCGIPLQISYYRRKPGRELEGYFTKYINIRHTDFIETGYDSKEVCSKCGYELYWARRQPELNHKFRE